MLTHARYTLTLITLLIFGTHLSALRAQRADERITFDSFSVRDGLSSSSVFSITQDADGFLWFATPNGLTRYDGYRFEQFRHSPTASDALPDDNVRSLRLDDEGRLWAGTASGLAYFSEGHLVSFPWSEQAKGSTLVYDIAPAANGWLLASDAGLLRFDESAGYSPANYPVGVVSSLLPEADATTASASGQPGKPTAWLIGGERGVMRYDASTDSYAVIDERLIGVQVNDLLRHDDRWQSVWIATEGQGLWLYDLSTRSLQTFRHLAADDESLSSDYVRSLAYDDGHRLWVGTFVGLNLMQRDGHSFRRVLNTLYADDGLSQNSIRALFADSQGGMWLGTYFGGVYYYHSLKNRFERFSHHRTEGALSDRVIGGMAADGDILWIGTNEGGLNKMNLTTGENLQMRHREGDPTSLSGNNVKAVLRLADGMLAVGSHDGGLCTGSGDGRFRRIRFASESGREPGVYALAERTDAPELWIGTLSGLYRYDLKQRLTLTAADSLRGEAGLQGRKIFALNADSRQRLWLGTDRGLYLFRPTEGAIRPLPADADGVEPVVNCLLERNDGTLFAGTRSGLFVADTAAMQLVSADKRGWSPTADFQIYGIEEDAFHRLWLSTDRGLLQLDRQGKSRRLFTEADGVRITEFNLYSHCKSDEGRIFFGGIDGVTAFYPERLMTNPFSPKPMITGLSIADRRLAPGDDTGILQALAEHTRSITLQPDQNWLSIDYGATDFLSGRRNRFAIRLVGLDNEWRSTSLPSVSYSNLLPGSYTFEVRCANSDGKWSTDTARLSIRVLPHWWQTWWARLIAATLLFGLLYWLFRFYERRRAMREALALERREKEQVAELGQMKIRFFINISHELRTPLTLILSPVCEMLERGVADPWLTQRLTLVRRNAQRMLNLVNQVIDYRRAELGVMDLRPSWHTPASELRELFELFAGSAANRRISYEWTCGYAADERAAYDGNYLERILTNLIANALKYTPAGGRISVGIAPEGGKLRLTVADTGCGIAEADQARIFDRFYQVDATSASAGAGIGLSFVKLLVEHHGGTIALDSRLGEGATFTVIIPARRDDYPADAWVDAEADRVRTVLPEPVLDVAPADDAPKPSPTDAPADAADTRETLLIVDDDAEIRSYLCEALADDWRTIGAADGEEAWQLLESAAEPIALVVSDVMMPRIDGMRLCSMIKRNVGFCHIPVVLLTAKVEQGEQLDGLNAGADDYICKPFVLSLLRAKIRNILRGRKLAISNYAARPEATPTSIATNTIDEELLRRAVGIVESNIDNEAFSAEQLARDMGMSRSSLHLKLKSVTGESAVALIRRVRLGRACQLLKEGRYNVAEISGMVGLSPAYFSTTFKKYMGCHPSEYAASEADKTK